PGTHVTNGPQGVFTVSGQLDRESRPKRSTDKKGFPKKVMVAVGGSIVVLLVVAAVAAGTVFGLNLTGDDSHHAEASTGTTDPPKPCSSEQCQFVSDLYNESLSPKYEPCDDFYKHVCTRWKLAPSSKLTSVFGQQNRRILLSVIDALHNKSVTADSQTAIEKAAGLFQTCVALLEDGVPSGQDTPADIMNFLGSRNALFEADSVVDPAYLMLDFSLNYGLPTLFDVRVDAVPGNDERLYLVLSMRRYFVHRQPASSDAIKKHLQWLGLDDQRILELSGTIATIEEFLMKLGNAAAEDDAPDAKDRSVYLLRTMEKAITFQKGNVWNDYMRNVTDNLLPEDHYVAFQTRYLVTFLALVFQKIDPNHLRIWIIFDVSRQLRQMVDASSAASSRLNSPVFQWELRCLKLTSQVMNSATYSAFYHTAITSETISKAEDMVLSIADSLRGKIAESSWVEDGTKQIALRKLANMKKIVGYPEGAEDEAALNSFYEAFGNSGPSFVRNWLSASQAKTRMALKRLSENPFKKRINDDMSLVNAVYKPPLNAMVVGLGLLLPPFFDTVPAVDYASAGHLAAHEMMHAFDVSNRRRDDNNVERNWWTSASEEEYDKRVMCIRHSYMPLQEDLMKPDDVTDSEIMADFIGLSGLYEAYQKAKEQPGAPVELEGLPEVTSDQLFFIAFCYKWCSNSRPTDRYPDMSVRCNMPLMNMPEFSAAFKCSGESRMNPSDKCSFW
ncbi:hypothetical protein V5799_004778, partial [Amblyomma americanum]